MEMETSGWTIDEYVTARGENLVLAFLSRQTGKVKAEAIALLKLLQERGNLLGMPHSKPLGGSLFELRGNQVRIFYMFRPGRRITLLDGMMKKKDRIPITVLDRVRRFQREVEAL